MPRIAVRDRGSRLGDPVKIEDRSEGRGSRTAVRRSRIAARRSRIAVLRPRIAARRSRIAARRKIGFFAHNGVP